MRYNKKIFLKEVDRYKNLLSKLIKKGSRVSMLVHFNPANERAFYSIAPLSCAAHTLGADINVMANESGRTLEVMRGVWALYSDMIHSDKKRSQNPGTKILSAFIEEVEKKAKGRFSKIFKEPDIELEGRKDFFMIVRQPSACCAGKNAAVMPYKTGWAKKYRYEELKKTAKLVWKEVFALKKDERVSVIFETVPRLKDLGLPLDDYLDSYFISRAMIEASTAKEISSGASSSRRSQRDEPERTKDMLNTLIGCELSKNSDEPVFRKYRKLSALLGIGRLKVPHATFAIHGKGYSGRHLFGELIGYPSSNKKTRWPSPGMMIFKLEYYPQAKLDPRRPLSRIGFTETLPIDVFLQTVNIDYEAMRKRSMKIKRILDSCDKVFVKGRKIGKYKTDFEVTLREGKKRHTCWPSVSDAKHIINPFSRKKGIIAGSMANIPSGESFLTPVSISGTFIGDVVISLDQSYPISRKSPIIVKMKEGRYKIANGDKKIISAFNKKKRDAWKRILAAEQHKSLPKKITDTYKKNFDMVGEFAINTNTDAELCNYLIVNEKIANMIHIALGSGFEPETATEYHCDIVIDSPRQKLDIYGVDSSGRKKWIHKGGKFVV